MCKKASLVLGCILASSWAQTCFALIAEAEEPGGYLIPDGQISGNFAPTPFCEIFCSK